jgi:hypothetical protein
VDSYYTDGGEITADPNNNSIFWSGGTYNNSVALVMSVSRTTDMGTSWLRFNLSTAGGYTYSIAVSPGNSNIVYAAGCEGTAAAIYKTTNSGTTWFSASTGLTGDTIHEITMHASNPNILYAANAAGIFKSTNAGANWVNKSCPAARAVLIDRDDANIVYAGTDFGVFKSTNQGDSWTEMNTGLRDNRVNTLGMYPGVYVFASTRDDGIYRWDMSPSVTEETNNYRHAVLDVSPNPAVSSSTRISFQTASAGSVVLSVYDIQGRLVSKLIDGYLPAGTHSVTWSVTDAHNRRVAAGAYILNLRFGPSMSSRSLVVIRE